MVLATAGGLVPAVLCAIVWHVLGKVPLLGATVLS